MSRRGQVQMTPEEIEAFLQEGKTANIATIGPNGRPHLTALWYVPRGDVIETWTYAKSQKALNLQRLPQATILVETGDSYEKLRGVSMECDVELVTNTEKITMIGQQLMHRYSPNPQVATAGSQFVRLQAPKRVGLVCRPTKIVSWDHGKLGGAY
ncbi:pyridoxamine 5'-phosphate oxidase family protein [Actinophytocola algeriensis]|uniref:PPOX class probable F420-dependent enzyme n=1 Tax=Actinophytocola algeriensis TaxID=1768010 RepID=A0A7W7Q474_9PSEU|nr:pyridoxamine 5'-phosphate oxidase family protein [Actinophytocola algeriensis]MBB4906548.1 PPOX class probable F420-dependent enzyme [Actinophytocola algeriensis]MBE1478029.1 PPOX class probable F420-dependent enzyme [Actinophytocola algeriensis]